MDWLIKDNTIRLAINNSSVIWFVIIYSELHFLPLVCHLWHQVPAEQDFISLARFGEICVSFYLFKSSEIVMANIINTSDTKEKDNCAIDVPAKANG